MHIMLLCIIITIVDECVLIVKTICICVCVGQDVLKQESNTIPKLNSHPFT
jgi:hypothetical protein